MTTNEHAMQAFARDYMAAYNQQNVDALKSMYSEYVTRIDQAGEKMVGADQVVNYLSEQFRLNNATLLLRQRSVHWSDAEHAWVARGTYEIYGITNVYDIEVHTTGVYTNTMIQDKDQWKIAQTVLTPIVKIMVHHQVEDFAKWKSNFAAKAEMRSAAGEISSEFGTLHDDPKTVYVLSEWTSLEAFQAYAADPKTETAMQAAGVIGKPAILILDQQ